MIRGENLVLLGELDMEKEARGTALREVPLDQILAQKAAQKQEKVFVCNRVFPCAAKRCFGVLTTGVNLPSCSRALVSLLSCLDPLQAEDDLLRKKLSQQALGLGFEDCL